MLTVPPCEPPPPVDSVVPWSLSVLLAPAQLSKAAAQSATIPSRVKRTMLMARSFVLCTENMVSHPEPNECDFNRLSMYTIENGSPLVGCGVGPRFDPTRSPRASQPASVAHARP